MRHMSFAIYILHMEMRTISYKQFKSEADPKVFTHKYLLGKAVPNRLLPPAKQHKNVNCSYNM